MPDAQASSRLALRLALRPLGEAHPPRPQAQLSPGALLSSLSGPCLDPTSHLALVDLQPLQARLLKVTWAGLQGKSQLWFSVPTCAWPDSGSNPEQTHNVPRAYRAGY